MSPRPVGAAVRMRIVVEEPVPGVTYSLQGRQNHPVGALRSAVGEPLAFEFDARADATDQGVRWLGDHIRREGVERRFVYIALGTQAGDTLSPWSRRMKIDVHTIGEELVAAAARGKVLEVVVAGTGADGTPACATVKPTRGWHAV